MTNEVEHLALQPGAVLHVTTARGNTFDLRMVEVELEGPWAPRLRVDFSENHPGLARPHEVMMYAANAITEAMLLGPNAIDPKQYGIYRAFANAPADVLKPGTALLFAGENRARTWTYFPAWIAAVTATV